MEVLREIQELSDEEVEEYCKERIGFLEDYYQKYKGRVLGYNIGLNHDFIYQQKNDYCAVETHCFYGGYIPQGTKLIFGFGWNGSSYANSGQYYYIDDTSYIVDFVKFIREKEVNNEYELFDCILDFLNKYFGRSRLEKPDYINRNDMCKMICKSKNTYYNPVKEHSIKMFKDRGNAVCTENSVIAQNLLSFLNIESYIVIGLIDRDNKGGSDHAFNLISYEEEKTGEIINSLIDFSVQIPRIDIDYNVICYQPYMIDLETLDEDFVKDLFSGELQIEGDMYSFLALDQLTLYLRGDSTVKYYVVDNDPAKKRAKVFEKIRGEAYGHNR